MPHLQFDINKKLNTKDKNIGLVYSNCYLFFENKKKEKFLKERF